MTVIPPLLLNIWRHVCLGGKSELNHCNPWDSPPGITDWGCAGGPLHRGFPYSYTNNAVGS